MEVECILHVVYDIKNIIKSIRYNNVSYRWWYRHPKFSLYRGLRLLHCDIGVLQFASNVNGRGII